MIWSIHPKESSKKCESVHCGGLVRVRLLIKDQAFNLSKRGTSTMFSISEMATKVCFATMTVVSSSPNCVPFLAVATLSASRRVLRKGEYCF